MGSAACLGELLCDGPAVLDEACLSANCSNASPPSVPLVSDASTFPLAALDCLPLHFVLSGRAFSCCPVYLGRLLIGPTTYGTHLPAQ